MLINLDDEILSSSKSGKWRTSPPYQLRITYLRIYRT